MASSHHDQLTADALMSHDHAETVKAQDRERLQNRDAFDSAMNDDYTTGQNTSTYSEERNQSRFTDENDYPDGNMERFENNTNERHFTGEQINDGYRRAYDRSRDYAREREDDRPFLHADPDQFYGQRDTIDAEGHAAEQFTSDRGDRYFTGNQGYDTKQATLKKAKR